MKYFDETSKERITNLKNLLDNFEEDKEISENNSKKYLKKLNQINNFTEKMKIYLRKN